MKNLLLFILLSFSITSCSGNSFNNENSILDEIFTELDSLSFEESQKKFVKEYDHFLSLLAFFENDDEEESKLYTQEEEKEANTKPFSLPTTVISSSDLKNSLTAKHSSDSYYNLSFLSHKLSDDSSKTYTPNKIRPIMSSLELKIDNNLLYTGTSYSYILKKIYYKDGSDKDVNIEGKESQNEFSLADFKQIDSITVEINYEYPSNLITKTLSNKNKTSELDGSKITLEKIDNDLVNFILEKPLSNRYLTSQAKTKSGYLLDGWNRSSMPMSLEDSKKFYSSFKKYMGRINDKIKANKFKSKDDLIQAIKDASKQLYMPEEKNRYYSTNYRGDVDEIYLYFAESIEKKVFEFTIPVNEELLKINLINEPNYYTQIIVDENAKVLANIQEGYTANQLNNYFYFLRNNNDENDEEQVYRLDTIQGLVKDTPDEYSYSDVSLGESLLGVHKNGKRGAIDESGKIIIPIIYRERFQSASENIIIANTSDGFSELGSFTIYNLAGEKIGSESGYLYDFHEGLAIATKSLKPTYSFVNTKGKSVINLSGYDSVDNFSDGLALVKKNNKIGYIDKTGKIIIPMIYSSGEAFNTGVTRVVNDSEEYALINNKNEIVLPFKSYMFTSRSGRGNETVYTFEDKSYNSAGELLDK